METNGQFGTRGLAASSNVCVYYSLRKRCGSHEGGFALLQVVTFGPSSRLAAEAHDEAALVDEVAGDVHGQQEEYERHHQDPGPQHDAHGERRFVVHVCRTSGEKDGAQHRETRKQALAYYRTRPQLQKTGSTHLF